ncbi:MAG: hypothetical protein HY067_15930 [Betaproteobacteria bacterium]|nr:hypothetical protein [Betaproteobacteria bacterium]
MEKLKHINLSGFPLQIGLAHAIDASKQYHGWKVLHQEHGWTNERTQESGFIDLVVENRHATFVLNIECKRPQEATWQFLLPRPQDGLRRHCKFWASYLSKSRSEYFDWIDCPIDPDSYESEFCVVAGQDAKARPMLERIAASVVSSTEAIAQEEAYLLRKYDYAQLRVYVSVIATTAKLEVCKFDPKDVDLETGTIAHGDFENVPYLRFRKQLSHLPNLAQSVDWAAGFGSIGEAKENTVLVVEASALPKLLGELELDNRIGYAVSGRS